MTLQADTTQLLDEHQAAKSLGMSVHFMRRRRYEGGGPPYFKVGRNVRYRPADVAAWLEAHRRASTAAAGPTTTDE